MSVSSLESAVPKILEILAANIEGRLPIGAYQVGSSLLGFDDEFVDLDLLFIDLNASRQAWPGRFRQLRQRVVDGEPRAGAFDSTPETFKCSILSSLREDFESISDGIHLSIQCSFGPIMGEVPSKRPLLLLHVCGPMSTLDLREMSRELPFHALAFLSKNNAIVGPPLTELCQRPTVSRRALYEWNLALLRLAQSEVPASYKLKSMRKMILCRYLFLGDPAAYEKVTKVSASFGITNKGTVESDLRKLAEKVYNFSLAGI